MYLAFRDNVSPNMQKVVSSDGRATLEIPDHALPEGVSVSDISLTNISNDATTLAYELKPDGTTFLVPTIFTTTFTSDTPLSPIPLLMSSSGDTEALSGAEISIDLETKITKISVPVTHFSILEIPLAPANAFFKIAVEIPAETYLEDIVTSRVTLSKSPDLHVLYPENFENHVRITREKGRMTEITGFKLVRDSVTIAGRVFGNRDTLSPDKHFPDRPPLSQFNEEIFSVESRDYRCAKTGRANIDFRLDFTYDGEAVNVLFDPNWTNLRVGPSLGVRKSGTGILNLHTETRCIERPYDERQTPTSVRQGLEPGTKATSQTPHTNTPATPSPTPKPSGAVMTVCGLPGGPACPKR